MPRYQRFAAALAAAALCLTIQPATAQPPDDDRQLARLSAQAESPTQHARAATLFRERAHQLDREATRLERQARRLEAQRFPHEHKLPAIQQPGYRERQRASEARSRAREHRVLAQRHDRTARELHAEP